MRDGLRFRAALIALVVANAGSLASRAHADSAEDLLRRGFELRKAGRDIDAVAVFKDLIKIDSSPRAVAQLGLAEQAAGMWVEADEQVGTALRATRDPWIKKNQVALRKAFETIQERLGRIEVWGDPPGAEVLFDGKVVGTLPLAEPIRVVAGTVSVTVRAAGYVEKTTPLTVGPKKWLRERFDLPPVPVRTAPARSMVAEARTSLAPVSAPPPLRLESQSSDGVHKGQADGRDDGDAASSGGARRSLKWISGGLGVAAAGVGIYGYLSQRSAAQDFNRPQSCITDPTTGAPVAATAGGNSAHCLDLKNRVDRGFQIEVIGLAAAGALLSAGLVLWLTESTHHPRSETAWLCAPGATAGAPASVGCRLTF